MPALPVFDTLYARSASPVASSNIPQYMLHTLVKRDCDPDDDDCDDIDPTVPAIIVIVVIVVILLILAWICLRKRNGRSANPWSSKSGNSKPGFGPFGLMNRAWQQISPSKGGKDLTESPSQTWPGQDIQYEIPTVNPSNNPPQSTNVLPFVRGRATVYRPHSKTLSQLGPPPAYAEADPDPHSTIAGVERSLSRPRASEPPPAASSNSGLTWGRSRSTDQQRRGGSGQVELVEQSSDDENPFADR